MDDYAQYSNMMNQVNAINASQREIVNEKKEDMESKLAEYKKTLEMTTEGIGGGILHDVGINLIKKGYSAIKSKIPVPEEELENMLKDYQSGGAKKMFEGMAKRGYSKAKTKMFGEASSDDAGAESSVKKVFGNLFKRAKAQDPDTVSTNIEDNFVKVDPPGVLRVPASSAAAPDAAPATAADAAAAKQDFLDGQAEKNIDFNEIDNSDDFTSASEKLDNRFNQLPQENRESIEDALKNNPDIKSTDEINALPKGADRVAAKRATNTEKQNLASKEEEKLFDKANQRTEPNFDNISSKAEFKVENKLLKDKVKSLDSDTKNQIKSDVDNDPLIKKSSEIKQITDPDEKLAEQAKRAKALNEKINEGRPADEELQAPAARAATQLTRRPPAEEEDDLEGGGEDDDDAEGFQQPKPLGTETETSDLTEEATDDVADDVLKSTAKKAGEKLLETDAELGGPEDVGGDVISGVVALGTLLGGIFGAKGKHLKGNFPAYTGINPTFQSGAG